MDFGLFLVLSFDLLGDAAWLREFFGELHDLVGRLFLQTRVHLDHLTNFELAFFDEVDVFQLLAFVENHRAFDAADLFKAVRLNQFGQPGVRHVRELSDAFHEVPPIVELTLLVVLDNREHLLFRECAAVCVVDSQR